MTKSESTFLNSIARFQVKFSCRRNLNFVLFAAKEDFQSKMKKIVFLENKPKKVFLFNGIQTKKAQKMDSEEQEENVFFHSATESILRIRIRDKIFRLKAYF